jgi:hypothetical protein
VVLLKKGRIVGKWHHNNIPSNKEISKQFFENDIFQNDNETDEEAVLASII